MDLLGLQVDTVPLPSNAAETTSDLLKFEFDPLDDRKDRPRVAIAWTRTVWKIGNRHGRTIP